MGQPNAMSTVQQSKKKPSNYAKTLAEIKNSISQFERTDNGRAAAGNVAAPTASDIVNYMMSLGIDEVCHLPTLTLLKTSWAITDDYVRYRLTHQRAFQLATRKKALHKR